MAEANFIPLSVPNFAGREREYVDAAVVSEWVSSGGAKVTEFENAIAGYCGMPRAVAACSGTAGLHLALLCAGVKPGDEVIVPALTFIAAVNPVRYAGAEPVFLGCDDSLCMDPQLLGQFLEGNTERRGGEVYNKNSGRRIAAVMVVHVFGNLADMPALCEIAAKYGLPLIEDATEALGSRFEAGPFAGKMAGTMGDAGVYSFNGNKIITTGAGGMLISNHGDWAQRAKHLSTQAKSDELYFLHDEVGYNYRLSNIPAALGLAQLAQLEGFIGRKKELYERYRDALDGKVGLRLLPFREGTRPNRWFFSLYLTGAYPLGRDALLEKLKEAKIQARPIWALIHEQKPYRQNEAHGLEKAEDYRARIVNLPCSTNLSERDQQRVMETILSQA
ncbi:LegC family aminotransferase [Ruminococcaceae bacterium OttesenSCG-928-I18]|nr:LegC family aminotransferase [Ruminococcaceae bacterium OttesenSCG-928-I18]